MRIRMLPRVTTSTPGDVVGLVEIMKNFHEITTEESGRVARILVENEALIEAGQDVLELE